MFAVIETGGKQYKVREGDVLDVELVANEGDNVTFDKVVAISDDKDLKLGTPVVDGAEVKAEMLETVKGDKLTVFKMKRRKGYRNSKGHRQKYARVKITSIKG